MPQPVDFKGFSVGCLAFLPSSRQKGRNPIAKTPFEVDFRLFFAYGLFVALQPRERITQPDREVETSMRHGRIQPIRAPQNHQNCQNH